MKAEVEWFYPHELGTPHEAKDIDKVEILWNAFTSMGWDHTKAALIGYREYTGRDYGQAHDEPAGPIQLLSGSHRLAAASRIEKFRVPVILIPWKVVSACWGNEVEWKWLMQLGNNRIY